MAGEQTNQMVEAAARGAAMQAGALKRVADGFSTDPGWSATFDGYKQRLDAAGHVVGGGYDDCEVCQEFAGMLPQLIMQQQQQAQAGQQGKPGGQ